MEVESRFSRLTQSEHEVVSAKFLTLLRDSLNERMRDGQLEETSPCGSQSQIVNRLIWCFFDSRRDEVGIPYPSSLMSVSSLRDFINDEVLPVINEHKEGLLTKNWNGEWNLIDSEDELYS